MLGGYSGGVTSTRPALNELSLLLLLHASAWTITVKVSHGPKPVECLFSVTLLHGAGARGQGRAVQADPIKPKLTAPGSERLKLEYDGPLSSFAFKFNLRRYTKVGDLVAAGQTSLKTAELEHVVGRCRLTLSNPS
jgi:hypothetical protein